MTIAAGEVRILKLGIDQLQDKELVPWLQGLLNTAQRTAVREVNKDTGNLANSIETRIETGGGKLAGFVEATANYALWQETVPRDQIPGVGERKRSGGKPYLRPGLLEAIRPYIR